MAYPEDHLQQRIWLKLVGADGMINALMTKKRQEHDKKERSEKDEYGCRCDDSMATNEISLETLTVN